MTISFVFAFFVALVFHRLRGQAFLLSVTLLPITIPPVVVGLMFKVIFVKNNGIADYLLTTLGIPAPNWIAEPTTALATLIGVAVWEDFPLLTIILMAGLKSIPDELHEAAALDGASFLAELRHITIPVMRPVIGAVIILSAVNAIKVFDIPFATFLMHGFMSAVPRELDEAAMMDGCSRLRAFFVVILPTVKPGLIATAIMSALLAWKDFLWALRFTSTEDAQTIPIGIMTYISDIGVEWGSLMAVSALSVLPLLVFSLVVQKHMVQGLTSGAVRG